MVLLSLNLQVKSDFWMNHRAKHDVCLSTDQSVFYFAQGYWHVNHVLVLKSTLTALGKASETVGLCNSSIGTLLQ